MSDEIGSIYQRRFQDVQGRRRLWETLVESFFQDFIDPTDIVLDIPCGYGEFINSVRCAKKYALDLNPDSSQHLNPDVEFMQGSSTQIPLPDDSLNKIFVSNFFEHLTRQDIASTVGQFHRVLKPSGRVLILQPNIRFAARDYWMFFDHITPIDDRALEEIFAVCGFVLTKRIVKFLPYTTQGRLPVKPWLIRLYLRLKPAWRLLGKQSFLVFQKT